MVNVLIADDNIYYAKTLMDLINNECSDVKVCNIAINGKETLEILNNKDNIDVILLDLKMPIYTGVQVIDMLPEERKEKYKDSCIVISGEINATTIKLAKNKMIYKLLCKTLNMSKIVEYINELIQYKKESNKLEYIRSKIIEQVTYLGYNLSYKGTKYLIDGIDYIAINQDKNLENLKRDVYPIIAKKYNQSIHNIKCNINRVTDLMYFNCESNKLKQYFQYYNDVKPNVKTVIYTIINKIY